MYETVMAMMLATTAANHHHMPAPSSRPRVSAKSPKRTTEYLIHGLTMFSLRVASRCPLRTCGVDSNHA